MIDHIKERRQKFIDLYHSVEATDSEGLPVDVNAALANIIEKVFGRTQQKGQLIFIGNGGSAAISSHMATDFCKNANLRALHFNEGSYLTCLSNDLGYEKVFERSIELFATEVDILFAISSSGSSQNILNAVNRAKDKGVHVITLSGFKADNPLRAKGDMNFYVPVSDYGFVEVIHHALIHAVLDGVLLQQAQQKEGVKFS